MFDVIKKWFWYDWLLLLIRLLSCVSLLLTEIQVRNELTLPLAIVLFWQIAAFSIPWLALLLNYKSYLITEMILFGGIVLYLVTLFPQAYLTYIVPAFLIAANSAGKSYKWTAPITVIGFPVLILLFSQIDKGGVIFINYGLAYTLGFAFHLLVVNHRQNEIIRDQNYIMKQYMSQIERITLLEERNRLSKDLHDTMGHSYTTIIMGLETLKPELATEAGQEKLGSLLQVARKSMNNVRSYLHGIESDQESLPLVESLKQLTEDFEENARVKVGFRTYGEDHPLPKQAQMAFYRCLQESLTNAVRHGGSTEIDVSLQFEDRQTRLEIRDNGRGADRLQDGFGLKAMKERAFNLQGQVSVYSGSDEGTVVMCTLPRQVEQPEEVIRLLLADDQPFIRESLRTILEEHKDLQVAGLAADGQEAVEMCGTLEPDLVVMDLDMPNMDGLSATQAIKCKWPHIRIVILTTFQDVERAMEVLRSGADGYLLKSIEPRELAETIRLVHRGGTMIAQDISSKLFEEADLPAAALHKEPAAAEERPTEQREAENEYGLTPREIEILQFLSRGLRYKTIAAKLYLSDGTVRNYASAVYAKLDVRNREEAVQKAAEAGLL
ncbi:hybrid sensor histidine kinase/response regulator transcription factor [Paenibacillus lutrae]|uniref:Response regulator n=1 Tax=Paenibacillus lutrae TaxID=2078573 RepID=A0A7X3FHV1_9BACL|nr:hybrid sensor histidine kinase/response regulator transcription factor [Paenibacillus lutrae]MVO99937.1 response regulator [Paenibacillus lutrae]